MVDKRLIKGLKTKKKIMDAAFTIFLKKGFKGASIKDIGAKAGISSSLVFHYFKNKYEILDEIIKSNQSELVTSIKNEFGRLNEIDEKLISKKIALFFKGILNSKSSSTIRLIMQESYNDKKILRYFFEIFEQININILESVMKNGSKSAGSAKNIEFLIDRIFFVYIPFILFSMMNQDFARYYKTDKDSVIRAFFKIFEDRQAPDMYLRY
jgi:AcrR family transcriptional regulator